MRNLALELHQIFNKQKRYYFPFDDFINEIPKNGIYIIFEKGERYKNLDRIVRVGTHTGNNQLRSRLKQHFIKENKNRSIFRKNIGRCFLNIEHNYKYFHIPIDNIIQEELEKYGIPKIKSAWSKIDSYDEYFNYQIIVRQVFKDRIPLDVEFEFFQNAS